MAHPDHPDRTTRHTYLLSLWQEGRSWRAALRPADGGPRQGFGDLDQLMAFLLRLQDEHGLQRRDDHGRADPPGPTREGGSDAHDETERQTIQTR